MTSGIPTLSQSLSSWSPWLDSVPPQRDRGCLGHFQAAAHLSQNFPRVRQVPRAGDARPEGGAGAERGWWCPVPVSSAASTAQSRQKAGVRMPGVGLGGDSEARKPTGITQGRRRSKQKWNLKATWVLPPHQLPGSLQMKTFVTVAPPVCPTPGSPASAAHSPQTGSPRSVVQESPQG